MDKERVIAQGHHAKRLLDDELLLEAFAEIHADILNAFRNGKREDAATYWDAVQALDSIIAKLQTYIANGAQAERN